VTIGKITLINLRNTFYSKYCKKTFLNQDFCHFRAWFDNFDVNNSCHVIVEHYLVRWSRDNWQITLINLRNTFYTKYCKKTFLNSDFYNFRAWLDSFDVSDSCHVIVEHYLVRWSRDNWQITLINLTNTFCTKYCKKTFLNQDFCHFRAWFDSFDVNNSCPVIVEHYLVRRSRDNWQITLINLRNTFYIKYCKQTFLNFDFYNFRAWLDSFDVSDSCHVIVEHYLVRWSRDNWQNNSHKSQKHVLYQILQENVPKLWFLQL